MSDSACPSRRSSTASVASSQGRKLNLARFMAEDATFKASHPMIAEFAAKFFADMDNRPEHERGFPSVSWKYTIGNQTVVSDGASDCGYINWAPFTLYVTP